MHRLTRRRAKRLRPVTASRVENNDLVGEIGDAGQTFSDALRLVLGNDDYADWNHWQFQSSFLARAAEPSIEAGQKPSPLRTDRYNSWFAVDTEACQTNTRHSLPPLA